MIDDLEVDLKVDRLYTKILIHEQKIFLASNCGLVSQIDYSNDYLMFYLSE